MSVQKVSTITIDQVVVVRCKPLLDSWECEFERTPVCLVSRKQAEKTYSGKQYEWYGVMPNSRLSLIRESQF